MSINDQVIEGLKSGDTTLLLEAIENYSPLCISAFTGLEGTSDALAQPKATKPSKV